MFVFCVENTGFPEVLHGAACLKWATELLGKKIHLEMEEKKESNSRGRVGNRMHWVLMCPQEILIS